MERLFRQFATILARVYLGGAPYQQPKPLPEILFYPVIFANGRDDDAEGLKAFYENRPYIFEGKVFQPSWEPRRLIDHHFALSYDAVVFIRHGKVCSGFGYPAGKVLTVSLSHDLVRSVDYSRFTLGIPVKP